MFNADLPNANPPVTLACQEAQVALVRVAPPSNYSSNQFSLYPNRGNFDHDISQTPYPDQISEVINQPDCIESAQTENINHEDLLLAQLQTASNQVYGSDETEEHLQQWVNLINNQDSIPEPVLSKSKTLKKTEIYNNTDIRQRYIEEGWTEVNFSEGNPVSHNSVTNRNSEGIKFNNIESINNNSANNHSEPITFHEIEPVINNNQSQIQFTDIEPEVSNSTQQIEFTDLTDHTEPVNNQQNNREIEFTNLESVPNHNVSTEIAWTDLTPDHNANLKPELNLNNEPNNEPITTEQNYLVADAISQQLQLIPMGINLGDRNVIPSTMIRSEENGKESVNFEHWLIPFNEVIEVLNYRVTTLDDGQLELRNFASVLRLDPNQLIKDDQLGLCFSVAQIRNLLGVPIEFSIEDYAVVLSPVWLEQKVADNRYLGQRPPINLAELPKIESPNFALTAIGQELNITGGSANNDTDYQGDFRAVGSLMGGSIYAEIDQRDFEKSNSWKVDELQYLRQTPSSDVAIGTQSPFWQLQQGGNYLGVTNIQRWGFEAPQTFSSLGNGFSPNERLRSDRVGRNIIGEAKPGTLARLVTNQGNFVVGEVLVDSSGIYRFEDISTSETSLNGFTGSNSYRVLLYPNGQLTATPEIREANYSTLPGQLSAGSSALIASVGSTRQISDQDFFGDLDAVKGGVSYRWGANDSLTLGAGVVYDQNTLGLTEMFFQPANVPLRASAVALLGTEKDGGIDYNANVDFEPTPDLRFNFNSDELSQRVSANWRVLPGVSVNTNWNSREDALAGGISLGRNIGDLFASTSVDIDTNNNVRWNVFSRFKNLELNHRGNEITTNTEFIYNFSKESFSNTSGHSLKVDYDTTNSNDQEDDLITVGWRYNPLNRDADGFAPWTFELGYGIGSQGDGFVASASTSVIPGLYVTTRYQDVSLTSEESSFSVSLSSNAFLQPQLSLGNSRFERLRSEGGLYLKPYFDENNNGQKDSEEGLYTEEADLLFLLNNQPLSRFGRYEPDVRGEGIFFRLAPDTYRLDVDPAGAPLGWKTSQSSYAVEVVAGSYTPVEIPLVRSYTVAGRVADSVGNPVSGVKVEAIPLTGEGKRVLSITNGAGIYYLEGLDQGQYNLFIDNQLAQPSLLNIQQNSASLLELNLGFGDSITLK